MAKTAKRPASKAAPKLGTPTDLSPKGVDAISAELRKLLSDTFALYIKTKNFHWHVSGPNFRDYHLLFDEHASQIYDMTDDLAERARKIGGRTIHSIGEIAKLSRVKDNDEAFVAPIDMLMELMDENKKMMKRMREVHAVCDKYDDVATASILENFIDQTERRNWFLFEISRNQDSSGH
jgi:starvation-inducible DNA-binding protein